MTTSDGLFIEDEPAADLLFFKEKTMSGVLSLERKLLGRRR
jgi:hypothetical protein